MPKLPEGAGSGGRGDYQNYSREPGVGGGEITKTTRGGREWREGRLPKLLEGAESGGRGDYQNYPRGREWREGRVPKLPEGAGSGGRENYQNYPKGPGKEGGESAKTDRSRSRQSHGKVGDC